MFYWSKRNYLYFSHIYGWLLWIGNSGSLIKLPVASALKIKANPEEYVNHLDGKTKNKLSVMGAIHIQTCEEYDLVYQHNTNLLKYDASTLILTIALTAKCNFRCVYCIESEVISKNSDTMTPAICDNLVRYITEKKCDKVDLIWYGGEPLLAFDRLKYITRKIKNKNISHRLITNGYLLSQDSIDFFLSTTWKGLQVTVDGIGEEHNARRSHKKKYDSFSIICKNLDVLYNAVRNRDEPHISIRVNIDRTNHNAYSIVKKYFEEKYGSRFFVYPGFVQNVDCSCVSKEAMTVEELAKYSIDEYERSGVVISQASLIMKSPHLVSCSAGMLNNYLIDWNGNAYKCWDDLGRDDRVIFTVDNLKNKNILLESQYMIKSNLFNDPKCVDCPLAFICAGGCPNVRMREKYSQNELCHSISSNFGRFLEILYEQTSRDIDCVRLKTYGGA